MKKAMFFLLAVSAIAAALTAAEKKGVKKMDIPLLAVSSPEFKEAEMIPQRYTCKGEDISPEISWSAGPKSTVSYALIMDDPDAPVGTWVHWVVYNIPASVTKLPMDVPKTVSPFSGIKQGLSSWKKPGYGGPCPPAGTHRYYFKIYAVDKMLDLAPETTDKKTLEKALKTGVVAAGQLMGKFKK